VASKTFARSGAAGAAAAVAVALLASGCAAAAAPPPPREPLQLGDVETVFYGFNTPMERVTDQIMRLYGDNSATLEIDSGQIDATTLEIEVRSDAADDEGTRGVRCFVYRLDDTPQQAHLEDVTNSACSGQPPIG